MKSDTLTSTVGTIASECLAERIRLLNPTVTNIFDVARRRNLNVVKVYVDVMRAVAPRRGRCCVVNRLVTKKLAMPSLVVILVSRTFYSRGLALPVAALGHTLDAREEAPRDVG